MKFRVQALRPALASGARGALPLVEGVCWGVAARNANHRASNVTGVTAGKMGHNSSQYNRERDGYQNIGTWRHYFDGDKKQIVYS